MAKAGDKPVVLGFISVQPTKDGGVRGGYLLTTEYGRPIEFHYTSEVAIPRPQQILHGEGFEPYLYAEIVAKPMTDRQGTAPRAILVDHPALLELRRLIPAAVIQLRRNAQGEGQFQPRVHVDFPQDEAAFGILQNLVPRNFDWLEPFERIDQALGEIQDPRMPLAG